MADKDPPKDMKRNTSPAAGASAQPLAFNKNINIFPGTPLPHYDRGPIKAFKAEGISKVAGSLIALVCDKTLTPRWQNAGIYAGIINPNKAVLVATGAMYWPPSNSECFMMIYENNWGPPLVKPQKKQAYGIKQDVIMDQLLPSIVNCFKDFKDKGFVHGGIRLDNMFSGNGSSLKSVILGDSLTVPPSYLQPVLYEPIERAMADPIARGLGTFQDDLYSLGVALTIMLRSNDPLEGLSDDEIIREKIERGSYGALTGKDRFTGAILELLRGILHDDKSQRWTIDEVGIWMEGQRLSPKQTMKRKKASRVFHMEGERYSRPEMLALDLPKVIDRVVEYTDDDKLELWLERSLEDKEALERYEQAVTTAREAGVNENFKHRLVSRISIALDPPAPIRYKEKAIFPDGFGHALAEAFATQSNLNDFADIIDQGLAMFWLNSQNDKTVDYGSISTRFETARSIIKNKGNGFGLERCLYSLNPETPCLSSKLKDFYVKTPEEMLIAFEKIVQKGDAPKLFLDRHSIAFLSVKDSRILDASLIELNAQEEYKNILGNVWAITNIQKRYNMPPLPHLAEHIIKIMDPVLERFHDRNLREKLKKEFEKVKKSGELERLTAILENVEIVENDNKNFRSAMQQYRVLKKEKAVLEKKLETKGAFGKGTGRTLAAAVSTLIGGLITIILIVVELSSAGVFR